MPTIDDYIESIRHAVYGKDVREAIASGLETLKNGLYVDTAMSDTSEHAVQNKVIKGYVDDAIESIPSVTVDIAMSGTSEHAVQNKVIKGYVDEGLNEKLDKTGGTVSGNLTIQGNTSLGNLRLNGILSAGSDGRIDMENSSFCLFSDGGEVLLDPVTQTYTIDGENIVTDTGPYLHGTVAIQQNKEVDAVKALLTDEEKPIKADTFTNFDTTIRALPASFTNNTQYRAYCLAPCTGGVRYLTVMKLCVDTYGTGQTSVCPMYDDGSKHFRGEALLDTIIGHTPVRGEEFYVLAVNQPSASTTHIGYGFKNVSPYDSSMRITVESMDIYPLHAVSSITSDNLITVQPPASSALDMQHASDLILTDGRTNYAISFMGTTYIFGDHDIGSKITAMVEGEVRIENGRVTGVSEPKSESDATTKSYVDRITGTMKADLTAVFSDEIDAEPYDGDAWAWIKGRITAGNFKGIHVGDYIPFMISTYTYHAEVAGIDTYKDYGSQQNIVRNHIDFITREVTPDVHKFNPVEFNNGTKFGDAAATEFPWLASDLYLWMNSLSGTVASDVTVGGGVGTAVDYTDSGIYSLLPDALKAVISEKVMYLEKRYNTNSLVSVSASAGWASLGKLWLPTEVEVYGRPVFSGLSYASCGSPTQYPIFAAGNLVKRNANGNGRSTWWLNSMCDGSLTNVCRVTSSGQAYYSKTSVNENVYVPICFRVMADAPVGLMSMMPNTGDEAYENVD